MSTPSLYILIYIKDYLLLPHLCTLLGGDVEGVVGSDAEGFVPSIDVG